MIVKTRNIHKFNQLPQSVVNFFSTRVANYFGHRKWSLETYPVRVVITGIEHSGTTILSILVKQHPGLNSGFECGFLLADRPQGFKDIHPWYECLQRPVSKNHWGISEEHMECICSSKSWDEAYLKLMKYSPVFDQELSQQVCDKTPRYMRYLDKVLDKLPDFVPCVVIEKDIENLWRSHKKRNSRIEDFCQNYKLYTHGLQRALKLHAKRIHRVKYEALCVDTHNQLNEIFSFLRLPFKPEYASNRHKTLLEYYTKNCIEVEPHPEEEMILLNRLKSEYPDFSLVR